MRSMLLVPLEIQGKCAAVLSIQSYEAEALDAIDLEFLQLLTQRRIDGVEQPSCLPL